MYSIINKGDKVKYPLGTKKINKNIYYGKRGMGLEEDINSSNNYYLINNIAVVHKKPTPVQVTKVLYPEVIIKEAYFKTPSTTDYNGIYKGRYIDFEAKETKTNFFPIKNIHNHQIKHLQNIEKHGGISFIIIRFTNLNETYYLETNKLLKFIETETRKSIPIEYFKQNAYLIKDKINPLVDYIEIIEKNILKGK